MRLLASLRSRIFLASGLLAVLCIGVAIYLVNARVTEEAERTIDREMVATAALVESLRAARTETFTLLARFIADAPKMKAAVDTNDPPTVEDIVKGYQAQLKSNLLLVTNKSGGVLAAIGAPERTAAIIASQPAVRSALAGHESLSLLPQPTGMLQLLTVPVFVGLTHPDILGTVSVGFMLDNAMASQLKEITSSDVAFGMDGQVLAATLPREYYPMLSGRLRTSGTSRIQLGAEEYEALPRSLSNDANTDGADLASGPVALILRSRTEQLQSLRAIHTGLVVTAVVAVMLATGLSFAVARTIAQPLAAISRVMREVAATGDLTRKIALGRRNRWDDEDARLLAKTFNTLTDSIARFQREMSQKERLTALGRLSTVIAHEIRNPLMIIKSSLHVLRRPEASPDSVREAVADIDEEVVRLNRIVNEVLDFARPIRFELAKIDLNALCRESAAAAMASGPGPRIAMHLDTAVPEMITDPERLRIALVNMLVNARHAVGGDNARSTAEDQRAPDGSVSLSTLSDGDRVRIVIADRGEGIDPGDLPHVFDPYFTTKRGGTGLGLPIAKNIVEGLSGTLIVSSTPDQGTEIHIDLPFDSAQRAPADPGRRRDTNAKAPAPDGVFDATHERPIDVGDDRSFQTAHDRPAH